MYIPVATASVSLLITPRETRWYRIGTVGALI